MRIFILTGLAILFCVGSLFAGSPPPPPPPPLGIPIDGGAVALLSIAAAVSGVRLYKSRQQGAAEENEEL